jgi:hypothetical protein
MTPMPLRPGGVESATMVSFFDTAKRKDRVAFAEARHDL